jgi:predicted CoA-binding protein
MNDLIKEFLKYKKIAYVGLSRSKIKFGNLFYQELIKRGYQIYPLHREEKEIDKIKCYPDLQSVRDNIEGVLINAKPKNVIPLLKELSALNIKNIWLQWGAESKEVYEVAKNLGLDIITKKCILMYAEQVHGIHKFHRTLSKLFGKL